MTPNLAALLILLAAIAASALCACLGMLLSRLPLFKNRRRARRWEELLDHPVQLPTDYPDSWTSHPDALDVELSRLHNELWPHAEYQHLLECEALKLPAYDTHEAAELATDRSRPSNIRECVCGAHHIHYRTRRATRPRAHH